MATDKPVTGTSLEACMLPTRTIRQLSTIYFQSFPLVVWIPLLEGLLQIPWLIMSVCTAMTGFA